MEKNIFKNKKSLLNLDSTQGPPACETSMLPRGYQDILIIEVKMIDL